MLRPRPSRTRQHIDLSGTWSFRLDPDDAGLAAGWAGLGLGSAAGPVAVPGSWNEQDPEWRDELGPAWYETSVLLPDSFADARVSLRFGSVVHVADVWLDGRHLGRFELPHLPFAVDATGLLQPGVPGRLVVRVDGRLSPDQVPPGNLRPEQSAGAFAGMRFLPATTYDFFPYAGVHRPVLLVAEPVDGLDRLEVSTALPEAGGAVVSVRTGSRGEGLLRRVRLLLAGELVADAASPEDELELHVAAPQLWSPDEPVLHELEVRLEDAEGGLVDEYRQPIGLRTVEVVGRELRLNGTPLQLRGFGWHEDLPLAGRGQVPAATVADLRRMVWAGANSLRTAHYPHAEQTLDLCDRLGLLVISETPAVGLFFHPEGLERRQALCVEYARALVERDRNHPCVVMWSVANEPSTLHPDVSVPFLGAVYDEVRRHDATRPVTHATVMLGFDEAAVHADVLCINRYWGWYVNGGDLPAARRGLAAELDDLADKHPGPILLTEVGADTQSGHHAHPPELFSEEYQEALLLQTLDVMDAHPAAIGVHVWAFADFKTPQLFLRPGSLNHKGVFTRDRRPKSAAHALRRRWTSGA